MPEDQLASLVDTALTQDNAGSKGYQWEADVLRDPQGRIEGIEYIQQKINEGYKLGKAWAFDTYRAPYGLYKPLKKPVQLPKKV